ncbi:MAG: acyl-CoA thioesterase [Gammaproteobacteria bacterium]|nr:acyl-CoA thioesterase [Gammaproteobacteria bacterium]
MIHGQYSHQLEFKVRDYECDMQAVVNNSVYQNYLEHARHEFLESKGINFADITREGINLVVVRAELDYRDSLKSNDTFIVKSELQRVSRLRFLFIQGIYRLADNKLMLHARITGTALNHLGRPIRLQALDELLTLSEKRPS